MRSRSQASSLLAALIAFVPRLIGRLPAYEFAIVGMYFIALLGLAILTGYGGQISLGARRIHGDRRLYDRDPQRGRDLRAPDPRPLDDPARRASSPVPPGLVVGIPALRLSGLYLALITFGIAVSFPQLPKKFDHFFGGTSGKVLNIVKPPYGLDATANDWLYYLTWSIAFVLLVAAWLLLRGEAGKGAAGDPRQ